MARFRHDAYWGRPVPGFGDPAARLLIVGLAPAAHGANRTGRMFTGDRSGDFLFAALHRAGISNQPTSVGPDDGLELDGAYVVAALRCAPPGNMPTADELARCAPLLDRELTLLLNVRAVLALGAIAWRAVLEHAVRTGIPLPRPWPRFGHGARIDLRPPNQARPDCGRDLTLVGSYHVSQQNTQTGRLTPAMFDETLHEALQIARA